MLNREFFEDYSSRANNTGTYPNKGNNIVYTVIGLFDEFGETVEKLMSFNNTNEAFCGIVDELGDVFWYFNQTWHEMFATSKRQDYVSYTFFNFLEMAEPKIMANIAMTDTQIIKNLIVYLSKLQGFCKKAVRENNNQIQKEKIHKFYEHYLNALREYCLWVDWIKVNYSGYYPNTLTLQAIAERNITKLEDRAKRNVLHGDGDKR